MSQRIILHLDVNSYFATMEQQAYPNLRGKPIGVAGKDERMSGRHSRTEAPKSGIMSFGRFAGASGGERTVVAGASIEAKKFGVKSGMSSWEARKLCPGIIIVAANYDRYIFTSKRIFSLMERFSPTVEVFSIDEAFLIINSKLETLSSKQIQMLKNQIYKNDSDFENWNLKFVSNLGFSASDFAYLQAIDIAVQLKQLIRTHIGSWVSVSIGISYGRTLAKLASELQKPDGLTVIKPEDFARIAKTTPIEELCGIGYRLRPRLNQLGISTIAELGSAPREMLVRVFGDFTGSWLADIGRGIDDNQLRSFRQLPQEKSVGHSYTLPHDLASMTEVKKVMLLLAERVGVRLRRKGLMGKTVSVYVRFYDKTGWGQQMAIKDYLMDGLAIYKVGAELLDLIIQPKPVRLIAITVSDLVTQVQTTKPLFVVNQRYEQLVGAIDKINNRYGEFTVFRGALAKMKQRIFKLPDGRNKRHYLPEITHINPFTKRV